MGVDDLYGGEGNDFLYGNEGNDILYGDYSSQYITDGASTLSKLLSYNDWLEGGAGKDKLFGGYGIDTYQLFSKEAKAGETDTIRDWDGKGVVRWDNVVLGDVKWAGISGQSNTWESADKK